MSLAEPDVLSVGLGAAGPAAGPRYHVLLSRPFDLEAMERGAEREQNPRHILHRVRRRLGAVVHVPAESEVTWIDRVLAKLVGTPAHWALARRLSRTLTDGDAVFCDGDDPGLALALWSAVRGRRPAIAIWVMNPTRKRLRVLVPWLRLNRRIDRFLVNTPLKVEQTRRYLRVDAARARELRDQTDLRFFSPGPRRPSPRPMIFSAGLERRDYRTLALAVEGLDVDVRIAAVSPTARRSLSTFPAPLPPNMAVGPYPWPEYRQAFRDCDVVVVPLLPSDYSPGGTVLMEAMACRKPVVVTRTAGSVEPLIDAGAVVGVRPGDPSDLRAALVRLLEDADAREAQAERGHRYALERFDSDAVVEEIVELMTAMAPEAAPARSLARTGS